MKFLQSRFAGILALILLFPGMSEAGESEVSEIVGVTVTPHVIAEAMKYRRPRDPDLAAKVQLFVRGSAMPGRINGRTPADLLAAGDWAWHDFETAVAGTSESLSVWTFNGKSSRWGTGQSFEIEGQGIGQKSITLQAPVYWMSAVTFLSTTGSVYPDKVVVHFRNESEVPLRISSLRFWLPQNAKSWQTLFAGDEHPTETTIPPNDVGFITLTLDRPLPLTYCALEVESSSGTMWEHLRINREVFDISGGWVGDHLTSPEYLKLLSQLHVNAGQIQDVGGYTDNAELYTKHPLKLFNRLMPLEKWDTDEWLPRIHAVEFLGEPQYGGGRPVPPQEVFEAFLPYRESRLATSVTHSEERIWREYAGLSDFPHYDAYRVVAPAADAWREYDRWGGERISWGAPLESIGDLCRSLRELNRPMPCACWSQGPHHGWGGGFRLTAGRSRRSPTVDELRAQALHALSTRITSLYWFNLSLKSLLKYPDTWNEMTRIGREIRMLEPFFLEGNAYDFRRLKTPDGQPDWDLASIAAPDGMVFFALDTAYHPDPEERVFVFGEPRSVEFRFRLAPWVRKPADVFRADADGVSEVKWRIENDEVVIEDLRSRDAIYIAGGLADVRSGIERRRQLAIEHESSNTFVLESLPEISE